MLSRPFISVSISTFHMTLDLYVIKNISFKLHKPELYIYMKTGNPFKLFFSNRRIIHFLPPDLNLSSHTQRDRMENH